jgi:hypothetical protein
MRGDVKKTSYKDKRMRQHAGGTKTQAPETRKSIPPPPKNKKKYL